MILEDFGKFLCIVTCIELWAADKGDSVFNEGIVEITIGIGRTVSSDKQVRIVEEPSIRGGCQLDLDRPLTELAL